ncbi:glycosyltransferase family 9 protein [Candidatus Kryptobacter tengchongensis]|uniref:Heptosyltransferase-2 n=1 Tax=Kryptobacter tengchongensis TaxID=1643429 RepID=A0A656D9G3_KRYT1|nr:glycosyltransferase family 9 protein [Candidatus Kryptobacter tengchongensis]CUT02270.1 heptosyltransferase-2 [Candidatus Kryptobacter tengchongensis]
MKVFDFEIPECKNFTGYKPCYPYSKCHETGCVDPKPFGVKILIINLDAMGNVLLTTSILPAIKRKYPESSVYWLTLKNTHHLLDNNPYLDEVFIWEPETWLVLENMRFDIVMNADKSRRSASLTMKLNAGIKLGYGINEHGQIIPLNKSASYDYQLGLDDELKFRKNQKTRQEILCEMFELEYKRDEYVLVLSEDEKKFTEEYKRKVGIKDGELVVGFNTGCSPLYPNKKMTIEQHVELIKRLSRYDGIKLVLLGGPEDTERNEEIFNRSVKINGVAGKLINTPTNEGIRRGICYENMCDVVITGDSYGMHLAIALRKFVIAWFGLSSWTEIDLYDRGVKLIPEGLECAPCWKKVCPYNLECIKMIDLDRIERIVVKYKEEVFDRLVKKELF